MKMWHDLIKFILQVSILAALLAISRLVNACPLCPQEHLTSGGIEIKQKCVDMGGYQLYMQTAGDKGPFIIFESGLGDTLATWNKVVPQVARFAHTVTYDRSGLGRSEANLNMNMPITAQQAVANLRMLLAKSSIFPPYILVGHSLGGLYMQLFAKEYPQEVLGVVLVDSATSDQSGDEPLPPVEANYYLEAKGLKESIAQVKKAGAFPDVPLTILTTAQRGKNWLQLQHALTKLSPKSRQIITDKSGHHIASEEPALVINAIKEMVNTIQKPSSTSVTQLEH